MRLSCLKFFFLFFPMFNIFSLSLIWSTRAVKSDYIWPTVYHSLVAYSRAKLCLAFASDVFPGSVLNYGWHIKLSEPWLYCQVFMAGYVHNRAFQGFEYVWSEAYSSKNIWISARNINPSCRCFVPISCTASATQHTDSFSSARKVCFPTGELAGIYFAVRFTYQLLWN